MIGFPSFGGVAESRGGSNYGKRNFNRNQFSSNLQELHTKPALQSCIVNKVKKLRKTGVISEVVFWKQVRDKSFLGIDFDRQRIIGNYIVDFYIKSLGLIIEIDGASHNDKDAYDAAREKFLLSLGLKVYRISEFRVRNDLNNVMKELEEYIVVEFS